MIPCPNAITLLNHYKAFIREFGHANVPVLYSSNPQLGKWVENTRGKYNRGDLTEEQIQELAEAGFTFDTPPSPAKYHSYAYDDRWAKNLQKLIEYRNEFGDCNVRDDVKLSKWCENQKGAYKRNKLSQERIDRLKDVGFSFERKKRQQRSKEAGQESNV